MQVAGGTEQLGRLLRRLMQVRQAFIEPGECQRPILEIGGNAGCRGVHAHAERHRQVLLQQLGQRSEEHTSELQSLMRISYAVFCLKKKTPSLYTPIRNPL